jgi:hypothetical protein
MTSHPLKIARRNPCGGQWVNLPLSDKRLKMKHSRLWQFGNWVWLGLGVSALVACGGGGGALPSSSSPSAPSVSGFTPKVAVAGVTTTFAVAGNNLPLTVSVTLASGSCSAPTNVTATGFNVTCLPGSTTGAVIATVSSDTVANKGWWIGIDTLTVSAKPVVAGVSLLTDTGIFSNQCYAAGSDGLVSCVGDSVTLSDKQDGMTGRDVNADSNDGWLGLSYTRVATDCVKDNVTGLTWQSGSTTLTALPGDPQNQQAATLRTNTNTAALCGYSDWRIPTRGELQSLVDYGLGDANSGNSSYAIDTNWFVPPTTSAWYYSSSQYGTGSNVWAVNFFTGSVDTIGASGGNAELRLVR